MCIAIPMRVVSSDGFTALCERRDEQRRVNTLLVGENVAAGTMLSVFAGQALRTMTEEEAEEADRALTALANVMAGLDAPAGGVFTQDDADREVAFGFPDLDDPDHGLPPHLRAQLAAQKAGKTDQSAG